MVKTSNFKGAADSNSSSIVSNLKDFDVQPTPSFVGSALEFAQYCQEQFTGQSSHKSLLRKLIGLVADWIGVSAVSYIAKTSVRLNTEEKILISRFHKFSEISRSVINELCRDFDEFLSGRRGPQLGLLRVSVLGDFYYVTQFEEGENQRGLLIIKMEAVAKFAKGILIQPERLGSSDVLDFLANSAQNASKWIRRIDKTRSLLHEDELTGLYNYRYLDVALDAEIKRWQRFHLPFSLLFIDVDKFKGVNDSFGHMTGSSVLRQFGQEIKSAVRDVDIVIRYGGDEFVVVLIGTNSVQAAIVAERIRSRIERYSFKDFEGESVLHLTASIGIASYPEMARTKEAIIRLADVAMYDSKRAGRNNVFVASSTFDSIG